MNYRYIGIREVYDTIKLVQQWWWIRRRTADRSLQDKVDDTIQEETLQGNQTEQVTPIQLRDGYGEDVYSQDQI